jgi:hypothetical protein
MSLGVLVQCVIVLKVLLLCLLRYAVVYSCDMAVFIYREGQDEAGGMGITTLLRHSGQCADRSAPVNYSGFSTSQQQRDLAPQPLIGQPVASSPITGLASPTSPTTEPVAGRWVQILVAPRVG